MNIGYTPKAKSFDVAARIVYNCRSWHRVQQRKYPLHPAVQHVFRLADPVDWQRLLLEWPHVAESDVTRVAYTRDERAGIEDKQTLTSLGKYLKRHWPDMSDHIIRDMVAKYATACTFRIEHTTAAIVKAAQEGPSSCMQFKDDDGNDDERLDELGHHPYEVYAPCFGWHMATRWLGHIIVGRALLMQRDNDPAKRKYFVRTYRRRDGENYSQPDDELIQWLKDQGYEHCNSWHGERLAYLPLAYRRDEFIAPYIDGGAQEVDVETAYGYGPKPNSPTTTLRITDRGEWQCTNQDGTADEQSSCTCDACGARISEDEQRGVGYNSDPVVGDCCIGDYTYVTGRRGHNYYISDGDAVEVNGEYYDPDYLADNDIVTLYDGEYASSDDAVFVESQSEHYLREDCVCLPNGDWELDEDCVCLHDGEYALTEDAWQCAGSGEWYLTDDDTPVEVDGETYHEDNVPETDDDDETDEETEVTKEASC